MRNIYTKQLLKEISVLFTWKNKKWLPDTVAISIVESQIATTSDNDAKLLFSGSTSITANTFTHTNCNGANQKFASFSFYQMPNA